MKPSRLSVLGWVGIAGLAALVGCGTGAQSVPPAEEPSAPSAQAREHAEHEHRKEDAAAVPAPSEGAAAASEAPHVGAAPAVRDLLAEERAAYERARPVFEAHCVKCHTTGGANAKRAALKHFSMDSYPFGGHHGYEVTKTIREVLGATGEEPTMPDDDPGAVRGDDLARILSWADSFDRSHAADSHEDEHDHHEHDH